MVVEGCMLNVMFVSPSLCLWSWDLGFWEISLMESRDLWKQLLANLEIVSSQEVSMFLPLMLRNPGNFNQQNSR